RERDRNKRELPIGGRIRHKCSPSCPKFLLRDRCRFHFSAATPRRGKFAPVRLEAAQVADPRLCLAKLRSATDRVSESPRLSARRDRPVRESCQSVRGGAVEVNQRGPALRRSPFSSRSQPFSYAVETL